MNDDAEPPASERLSVLLAQAGLELLPPGVGAKFDKYLSLILRWNARTNLTAIHDEEGILSRHFVESIVCARALPAGIETLLDFGSGAGFPGIPIALCRPEISVHLAESQGKKAAFLREALRVLELGAVVHAGRAEALDQQFGCVTLRAVDHMTQAVKAAECLVRAGGWLALMTTVAEVVGLQDAVEAGFSWMKPVKLPGADHRMLALGQRVSSQA